MEGYLTYSFRKQMEPNRNRTENRNVLKRCAIFKNVKHSWEPGETPIRSVSHQASNSAHILNIAKHGGNNETIQFTGNGSEPNLNRIMLN